MKQGSLEDTEQHTGLAAREGSGEAWPISEGEEKSERKRAAAEEAVRGWTEIFAAELDYLVRLYVTLNLGGLAFATTLIFNETFDKQPWGRWVTFGAVLAFAIGTVGAWRCSTLRLSLFQARAKKARDDAAAKLPAGKRKALKGRIEELKISAETAYRVGERALFVGAGIVGLSALLRAIFPEG